MKICVTGSLHIRGAEAQNISFSKERHMYNSGLLKAVMLCRIILLLDLWRCVREVYLPRWLPFYALTQDRSNRLETILLAFHWVSGLSRALNLSVVGRELNRKVLMNLQLQMFMDDRSHQGDLSSLSLHYENQAADKQTYKSLNTCML